MRGPSLATDMSQYLRETIAATPNIEVLVETEVTDGGGDRPPRAARAARQRDRARRAGSTAAALFVLIGARPHTDWLPGGDRPRRRTATSSPGADVWRPAARWPLERPPTTYETSVPGLFAVGDTRYGAVKRVASAVGEGSVVMPDVHAWLAAAAREPQAR